MEIRVGTLDDAVSIARLNVEVQNIHAAALPHIFKRVSDGSFALPYITQCLADPQNHFFIASVAGEDVGYVFARVVRRLESAYTYARGQVYIDQIAVRPEYQGQGCGAALIQAVCDLAKAEQIETVALDTWAFNDKAQAFFASQGFTPFNIRMWMQIEL